MAAGAELRVLLADPWGTLAKAWAPPSLPPECELSPTTPAPPPPDWAPGLALGARSPPDLGGPWWVLSLATPNYSVTALLQGQPPPAPATDLTVALSVFTRTPVLRGSLGPPLELHCAFSAPPGPFALEWRHQARGAGRRLLAYDSATARAPVATPGVQLLLGGPGPGGAPREVSLRLGALAVPHQGAYVCALRLPHGQAQQLLHVHVLEPPRVQLWPARLVVAPGLGAELRCEARGYFPLDVGVRWQRRASGSRTWWPLGDAWSGGHRRGPDGTYGRDSGVRLPPLGPPQHGDTYACLVTHPALARPRRLLRRVEVAGVEGPGVEDTVGLCLVAFVLCGLWRWLSPACPGPDQEPKKVQ